MRTIATILTLLMVFALIPVVGTAQPQSEWRRVWVPDTTFEYDQDRGVRAHTNHLILATPDGGLGPNGGMTPAQLRSFYGMPGTGGYNAIAIVDAYHYPTSLNDFNYFASHFGLPTESSTNALGSTNQVFQVVYASGRQPSTNGGWAQEEALDIEWAHAMAPGAKVYLVEAASSSMTDLMSAVDVASRLPNVKEVSMSWGGGEFRGETTYDVHFPRTNGIVYVAASGDTGGVVEYPAACPNVVAAGGTSVSTNSSGGLLSETGWSGSGGGTSLYEPKPSYQAGVANTPSTMRGVPDVSSDADPYTGVSVYDSTVYQRMSGWLVFGGTSVSTPCLAGMVNVSDNFYGDSTTELTLIYTDLGTTNLRDIVSGKAGRFKCLSGWDFVTGVGVPLGTNGL